MWVNFYIRFKVDDTVSQRCMYKLKIGIRINIPAIQQIHNEQDKLRNRIGTKFDIIFGDRK